MQGGTVANQDQQPPNPILKRCWRFICVNDQCGNMITLNSEPIDAHQALIEARASLGPKVMRVE